MARKVTRLEKSDIVVSEQVGVKHSLTGYEQETIINFNKDEQTASIFTYEARWQRHLENKLGLKPTLDNGFGGKAYDIDKKRIPLPRVPKKMTTEQKQKISDRLSKYRKTKAQ